MEVGHQLLQRDLLIRRPLQHQQHPVQGSGIVHRALVIPGLRLRRSIPTQRDLMAVIHRAGNAPSCLLTMRRQCIGGKQHAREGIQTALQETIPNTRHKPSSKPGVRMRSRADSLHAPITQRGNSFLLHGQFHAHRSRLSAAAGCDRKRGRSNRSVLAAAAASASRHPDAG